MTLCERQNIVSNAGCVLADALHFICDIPDSRMDQAIQANMEPIVCRVIGNRNYDTWEMSDEDARLIVCGVMRRVLELQE